MAQILVQPLQTLERKLYGHPLAGLLSNTGPILFLWERPFEKVLQEHGWEKLQVVNGYSLTEKTELFLSVYVDDIKLARKKQKNLMKDVYLGCTQRECQISMDIVGNCRSMFESRISAGATEKLVVSGKSDANISSWSYDMEGHAKTCVERYCELANKKAEQLYKVSAPCLDDHRFKKEELETVGELSKIWSQIVLKCLY